MELEAAGALVGWVASRAKVCGGRDMGFWEECGDGGRSRGGVGLGGGVVLSLGDVLAMLLRLWCLEGDFWRGSHTKTAKPVFPLPLGPSSRNLGIAAAFATDLYSKVWMRIGSSMATRRVMPIICGVGAKRAVAQLSSSYHAMVFWCGWK
jgi:hypothetical protein